MLSIPNSTLRWLTACAVALGLAASGSASAITLLDVGGTVRFGEGVDFDEALAISFTLDTAYAGVAISVPTTAGVACAGCDGNIWLTRSIGPSALMADVVASASYLGGPSLFSGLSLTAGEYFVVLSNDAGVLTWPAMLSAQVTSLSGVSYGGYFLSERNIDPLVIDLAAFHPQSEFNLVGGNTGLRLQVTAIPEPATLALLGGGMGLLALARSRRRAS